MEFVACSGFQPRRNKFLHREDADIPGTSQPNGEDSDGLSDGIEPSQRENGISALYRLVCRSSQFSMHFTNCISISAFL